MLTKSSATIYLEEFLHFRFAETLGENAVCGFLILRVGRAHPAFLNQPAAEVHALDDNHVSVFVHKVVAACFKKRQGFRLAVVRRRIVGIIAAAGECRRKRKNQNCGKEQRKNFFHNFPLKSFLP